MKTEEERHICKGNHCPDTGKFCIGEIAEPVFEADPGVKHRTDTVFFLVYVCGPTCVKYTNVWSST